MSDAETMQNLIHVNIQFNELSTVFIYRQMHAFYFILKI